MTKDECMEVARRLRKLHLGGGSKDLIERTLSDAIGAWRESGMSWDFITERLADLIDPTCEARRDAVFKPAVLYPDTELDDVGREETVYRCSRCGEIISYDEDYDPETDAPAYCEMCGSRITGIGEPWDE